MVAENFLLINSSDLESAAEFEEVLVFTENKEKKAMGNPYSKRRQIKRRIFGCIGDWIASVTSSNKVSGKIAAEFRGGKGNPYPKRGEIKVRIFKEWFQ